MEIDKTRTKAYKPSTNGVVERFYRTLNSMLGKVVSESQRDWDDKLPSVMAAYRVSPHSSTGFTPNRLFLGKENRMPLDLVMGLPLQESVGNIVVDDFVVDQREKAEAAYRTAREHLGVAAEGRKAAYDARVKRNELQIGPKVSCFYPRSTPETRSSGSDATRGHMNSFGSFRPSTTCCGGLRDLSCSWCMPTN